MGYEGDEGRGVPAKSLGEVVSNLRSGGVRMGKPHPPKGEMTRYCYGVWGKPAEVKHLSKRRKRERMFIPLVAASEKGRA